MPGSGGSSALRLVQQLKTLPREIVDKILDSLSVFKVLQLATWGDPVTMAYVLEHRHYRRVFLSSAQLEKAASRLVIWCQLNGACGWRKHWLMHRLAINPASSMFSGTTYVSIMNWMLEDLKDGYLRGSAYARVLSQFSPEPLSPVLVEVRLKEHFHRLWTAQEAIKELESQQLNVLADLMETYPHMLRWACDPRGDTSNIPPEHISSKLRMSAKKVHLTQYVRLRRPVYCKFGFRSGIMPLVPKNWCLDLLLESDLPLDVLDFETTREKGVKKAPNVLQRTSLLASGKHVPRGSGKPQRQNEPLPEVPKTNNLPLDVANDLRTVFRGLMHRYARPDHMINGTPFERIVVPDHIKIDWHMFLKPPRERMKYQPRPSFVVPLRADFQYRAENMVSRKFRHPSNHKMVKEALLSSVLPYHKQEVEWLRAFLRSVAYLETGRKERAT